MPRIIRPASDVTVGDWITAPLFSKLDEEVPDDSDLITATASDYAEIALDPIDVDIVNSVAIRIRAKNPDHDTYPKHLVVALYDGVTHIMNYTITDLNATMQTFTIELTEPQIASIVNWSDLRLRIHSSNIPSGAYAGSTLIYAGSTTVYAGQGG